jgi:ubiquinone/menaquinone biosynthesis C-methylase UbiE
MRESDRMSGQSEAARIQREYARRAAEIPADFYSLDKPANYFAHADVAGRALALLERHGLFPLEHRKIADIGCGTGNWMLEFIQWGADPENLFGIDLNAPRIEEARSRIPAARFEIGNAASLPLTDGSIDIACQFTAFSSVLDEATKREMAGEMLRVLRRRGAILWYDLRVDNPANPAVLGVDIEEMRRLFPGCAIDAERVTLAPPIARAIVPHLPALAAALRRIPFLRSHYLALIRKPA